MYTTEKVIYGYVFGTGERIEIESGVSLKIWDNEQMIEDGVDEPVEDTKKSSYEYTCAVRTWLDTDVDDFSLRQTIEISVDRRNIFKYCKKRFEIPNPELFIVLDGFNEGIHAWASLDDLALR